MIKFIRDDGLTLNITDYFKIISIEGLGTITQEIFTEKRAVGDGDIITGTRVSSRTVTITACNDYAGQFDTSREKINSFFNPKTPLKCMSHIKTIRCGVSVLWMQETYQQTIFLHRKCLRYLCFAPVLISNPMMILGRTYQQLFQ